MTRKTKSENAQNQNQPPSDTALIDSVFDSMGQASGATGIPMKVLRSSKRNGCSAFKGSRVHLGEFLKWYFAQDHERDEDAEKLLHARRLRAEELAAQEAVRTGKIRGELVVFEKIRMDFGKSIISAKTKLQFDAPDQIATEFQMRCGLPAEQIDGLREIIRKRVHNALQQLFSGDVRGICPTCKTEITN